jgi:hypothetical protein
MGNYEKWYTETERIERKYNKKDGWAKIGLTVGVTIIIGSLTAFTKIYDKKVKLYTQEATIYSPNGEEKKVIEQVEEPKTATLINVTSKWEKVTDHYCQTTKRYLVESNNKIEMTEEELMELIKNENNPFEKLFGSPAEQIVEEKKELTDKDKENDFATVSAIKYDYDKNKYTTIEQTRINTNDEGTIGLITIALLLASGAGGAVVGYYGKTLSTNQDNYRRELNKTFSNDQ